MLPHEIPSEYLGGQLRHLAVWHATAHRAVVGVGPRQGHVKDGQNFDSVAARRLAGPRQQVPHKLVVPELPLQCRVALVTPRPALQSVLKSAHSCDIRLLASALRKLPSIFANTLPHSPSGSGSKVAVKTERKEGVAWRSLWGQTLGIAAVWWTFRTEPPERLATGCYCKEGTGLWKECAPDFGTGGASKVDGCMRLPDDLHRQHS